MNHLFLSLFFLFSFILNTTIVAFHQLRRVTLSQLFCHNNAAGLLTGVGNDAEYYSSSINVENASMLLKSRGIFQNFVANIKEENIDRYLAEITANADDFVNSKKTWDREHLKRGLENTMEGKGNFVCVLGGKNSGKSRLIQTLATHHQDKICLVDMRISENIVSGMLSSLSATKSDQEIFPCEAIGKLFSTEGGFEYKGFKLNLKAANPLDEIITLRDAILKLVNDGMRLTLIIDEANRVLTIRDHSTTEEIKKVIQSLDLLTQLTKQTRKVSHMYNTNSFEAAEVLTKLWCRSMWCWCRVNIRSQFD